MQDNSSIKRDPYINLPRIEIAPLKKKGVQKEKQSKAEEIATEKMKEGGEGPVLNRKVADRKVKQEIKGEELPVKRKATEADVQKLSKDF